MYFGRQSKNEKSPFSKGTGRIIESCIELKIESANVFEIFDGLPFHRVACCNFFDKTVEKF